MSDLRRLAEAAAFQDGVWYDEDYFNQLDNFEKEAADFIVAASPAAILALLDERDRLRAALEMMIERVQKWCDAVGRDSSWDGWDHHYKAFAYEEREFASGQVVPSLLDQARAALDAEREGGS